MAITSQKQLNIYWRQLLANTTASAQPKCPHFGECGGCSMQNISAQEQLKLKLEVFKQIMTSEDLDKLDIQIVGSPAEYNYRLKMDYVLTHNPIYSPHDRLGLRKRKQFNYVIDLSECHLIPFNVWKKLRELFNKSLELGIPNVDLVKRTGFISYFVVRQFQQELMLCFVTGESEEYADKVEQLAQFALDLGFTSIHHQINASSSDVSFGPIRKSWGNPAIKVTFNLKDTAINLEIGPNNFCQNNIPAFEGLLEYVLGEIDKYDLPRTTLVDFYCGVGTIGLLLHNHFKKVLGYEINAESIQMAKRNAQLNNITNTQFEVLDVGNDKLELQTDLSDSLMIVDPPRTGLTQKGVNQVLQLSPQALVYISCNPLTQQQDLALLNDVYEVRSLRAFDMFPQTVHMESVAVLVRRN